MWIFVFVWDWEVGGGVKKYTLNITEREAGQILWHIKLLLQPKTLNIIFQRGRREEGGGPLYIKLQREIDGDGCLCIQMRDFFSVLC